MAKKTRPVAPPYPTNKPNKPLLVDRYEEISFEYNYSGEIIINIKELLKSKEGVDAIKFYLIKDEGEPYSRITFLKEKTDEEYKIKLEQYNKELQKYEKKLKAYEDKVAKHINFYREIEKQKQLADRRALYETLKKEFESDQINK